LSDRVAFVGNSTALGVLVANACAAVGINLVRSEDVGVEAGAAEFEPALREALEDESVGAVVVVFVPPLQRGATDEVARALRAAGANSRKPVVSTFLGVDGVPAPMAASGTSFPAPGSVPSYPSPERAVRALARAVRYAAWRRRPAGTVPELGGLDLDGARAVVGSVLAGDREGRPLTDAESVRLLSTVGLAVSAQTPAGAVPVEIGAHDDRSFGVLISFGIGGVATDLLGDRAYAAVPLTVEDAEELLRAPKAAPLLRGYGGAEPCDLLTLADVVLRLSALADQVPELIDCTLSVLAAPHGAVVRAASARVAPASARADTGPRRLRGL
jgi:acyl-CoA synthetase (NDP forming)